MTLKQLTTGEMVSLSSPWVDPKHEDHETLKAVPEAAALLHRVQEALDGLLAAQRLNITPTRLVEIRTALATDDNRHDNIVRGTHFALTGLAYLARTPEQSRAFLDLRDTLVPDGLSATQRSYLDEAGQAQMLETRYTPAVKAQLKKVKTPDGTLDNYIDEWLQVAARIGTLERERSGIAEDGDEPPASQMVTARNRWIRVVNTLVSNLELADTEPARKILDRITQVAAAAERRAAAGGAGKGGEGQDGPRAKEDADG